MIKKIVTKIRYPKLYLLLISIFMGILIYNDDNNFHFHAILDKLGYLGTFLAGMFFVYGFTVGPAIAVLFLAAQNQNLFWAGIAGSAGALMGSFVVFQALKISYEEEVQRLTQNTLFKKFYHFFEKYFPDFARKYFLPILAGIFSATPLPDEFTAALVYASRGISFPLFSSVAFIFNTFGIFILLAIGRILGN